VTTGERRGPCHDEVGGGFGEFLRGLLAGIPWSERAQSEETVRIAAPRSGLLRVDNSNGRTRVLAEDRSDVEVHLQKVARAESESAAQGLADSMRLAAAETEAGLDVEIEMPRRWNRRGHVNIELRVPRNLRVEVMSSNGKVGVEGLRAALRVRSSNGAVGVQDVEGDIEVQSSNARICCTACKGRLVARSSNGKIEVADHRGSIDAATSNGLIHAGLAELRGAVVLATSNGRIALELPETADADVDARVDNGVIRNQRSLDHCSHSSGGRLSGVIGRGGIPIKLRTSNGSISLR
jgi:DUF4097 and DUF4098 domain-containing protein YvlB